MPKYYCEYCDIYLTHSSPGGRRQHNAGRKHINNKIDYFFNLIRSPKFVPPAHVLESGLFGGMNVIMGSRPPILPQNIGIPGLLRPPSINPMVPWGNSMFMRGRGVAPMPPMAGVANPMMMPGRGGSNVVMPPHGYQPKLFERPPFS